MSILNKLYSAVLICVTLIIALIFFSLYHNVLHPLSVVASFVSFMLGAFIVLLRQQRLDAVQLNTPANNQFSQRFEDLADSVPILIWTATPSGIINYVSKQISAFCGLSSEQILDDWLAVLHPADRDATMQAWGHALANNSLYQVEYRVKRFDGVYIWHSVQGKPVFDAKGDVIQWYGSSVDIQNLKALQQESTTLVNRLHNTIESVTEPFMTLNKAFQLTYINSYAAELAGAKVDELVGQSVWSFSNIGEDSSFAVRIKEAMCQQHKVHFEEFMSAKAIWLDVYIYPSHEGLTIYFTDITQQRAERQELKLLRAAVSRLNDIILITEAEPLDEPGPRVVFVNEAFEKRTGYTKEEILGKTPRILQGEKTQQENLAKIRKALQQWQPVRTQLINYTKSGEEFWLELDIVPLANEAGWYTHWVAVERDITEQKRIEQQLVQAQKMEALGHITGGIAHDFNNLLTVVLGNAELITENLPANSDLKPLADVILNAASRGSQLTQSLLLFSSKQSLSPIVINVNELITSFKAILLPSLGEQHKLELQLTPRLPEIIADEVYLESSLLNLVINARDAMTAPGTVTLTTYTEKRALLGKSEAEQLFVVIAITDTGHGVPAELQPRIFEPFFSTKKPGYGTGLGLSMVFGFIRQSGGDIRLDSKPKQGSTFSLYLPVAQRQVEDAIPTIDQDVTIEAGLRILLVEDDDLVRQFAVNVLTKAGFIVTQANDATAAYDYLQSGLPFDILFTDIVMPGSMNGFDLAEQAAKLAPHLPVLFTSGYSEQAGKINDLLEQENALLRKPYRKNELLLRLKKLITDNKPAAGEK